MSAIFRRINSQIISYNEFREKTPHTVTNWYLEPMKKFVITRMSDYVAVEGWGRNATIIVKQANGDEDIDTKISFHQYVIGSMKEANVPLLVDAHVSDSQLSWNKAEAMPVLIKAIMKLHAEILADSFMEPHE